MITASFFAEEHEKALPVISRLAGEISGVEIRVDNVEIDYALNLYSHVSHPVIFTCISTRDGGRFTGSDAQRLEYLSRLAHTTSCLVDVASGSASEQMFSKIPSDRIIYSTHPADHSRQALISFLDKASALRPAFAKYVPTARFWHDTLELEAIYRDAAVRPLSFTAFYSGAKGIVSRVQAPSLGAHTVYCSVDGCTPTAHGQIPVSLAVALVRPGSQDRIHNIFGIVGNPVAHSLSPLVHNHLFDLHDVPAVYLPFECDDFAEFHNYALQTHIKGLSVTSPWKNHAFSCAVKTDDISATAEAANTLVLLPHGFKALSTDGIGMRRALEEEFGPVSGLTIGILGPGGAGRAIALSLQQADANVILFARDTTRHSRFATVAGVGLCSMECTSQEMDIIINCTGSSETDMQLLMRLEAFMHPNCIAVDLAYSPVRTVFLKHAEARGCVTMNGLPMFIHQAREQFRHWTGLEPDVKELYDVVNAALNVF